MSSPEPAPVRPIAVARPAEIAVAAIVFVVLLLGSLTWPDPVIFVNRAFFERPISINEVSFLGRGAPSWDVVYWWLVGMAVLALLRGRLDRIAAGWPSFVDDLRSMRTGLAAGVRRRTLVLVVLLAIGTGLVVFSYCFVDMRVIAAATGWRSDWLRDWVRLSNRLGGGANPPMIVLFFIVAGLALGRRDWWRLGSAMAVAGLVAGALSTLMKGVAQRARPDAWLGPAVFWGKGETSFPSGHTIVAFAMMVVIVNGSKSRALRVAAVVVACSIGAARVIALRHWPSDVLMSAALGSAVGLLGAGAMGLGEDDEPTQE